MGDFSDDVETSENISRVRPSLAQVKVVVEFMEKHPDIANRKQRDGMSHEKFKALWTELANIANGLEGATKSMKGWIKFWSDKRRSVVIRQKHINEGRTNDILSPLELKILDICSNSKHTINKRKNSFKQETCNGDDDSLENILRKEDEDLEYTTNRDQMMSTEADERHLNMMEKLVEVMDQQTSAMSRMAEATLSNSKALERIADASHKQAIAVDRLASTFENINAAVFDIRNAIMSIDYTMKRCYTTTSVQQRQNSNIFV
ncbi:unnamed protein product [Parnassius mnemosyne]|uniref:Regulatory protein zeste n=1 Tax=Parnassius mnemosyne TaxID=213953 RepID=A0AAV1M3J5_9NEOP